MLIIIAILLALIFLPALLLGIEVAVRLLVLAVKYLVIFGVPAVAGGFACTFLGMGAFGAVTMAAIFGVGAVIAYNDR